MLRLGSAKPGSWASFWTILTLVGLATRAGEWAVGGVEGREEGQDLSALAARAGRGRCPALQRRAACLRGKKDWGGRRGSYGQEDPSTVHCPRSFKETAWGGGAGELTAHPPLTVPFSLSPCLLHTDALLSREPSLW